MARRHTAAGMPTRIALCVVAALLWLPPSAAIADDVTAAEASATPSRTPTWTLSWSVAPAAIGLVELAVVRRLGERSSALLLVSAGRGTTALWSTRDIRGLTLIEGRWLWQASGQWRRTLLGSFSRGAYAGVELGLQTLRGAWPVHGASLGPTLGARWRVAAGLSLDAQVCGVVALSTLEQRGTGRRVVSWSLQPLARLLVGWTW